MPGPRLFLDTQVCIDVAKGKIPPERWEAACDRIRREFEYRISPITVMELFNGVYLGDDAHFPANRDGLLPLDGPLKNAPILPFPGNYVAGILFDQKLKEVTTPSDIRRCIEAVKRAGTRAELGKGVAIPGLKGGGAWIVRLSDVSKRMDRAKDAHVERLEKIRAGGDQVPEGKWWAGALLKSAGAKLTLVSECERSLEAVDAAYSFDAELFREVKGHYAIEDRKSDYFDIQQLTYLGDPRMRILTRDGTMIRRIKDSPQASRVLHFDTF